MIMLWFYVTCHVRPTDCRPSSRSLSQTFLSMAISCWQGVNSKHHDEDQSRMIRLLLFLSTFCQGPALGHMCWPSTWAVIIAIVWPRSSPTASGNHVSVIMNFCSIARALLKTLKSDGLVDTFPMLISQQKIWNNKQKYSKLEHVLLDWDSYFVFNASPVPRLKIYVEVYDGIVLILTFETCYSSLEASPSQWWVPMEFFFFWDFLWR